MAAFDYQLGATRVSEDQHQIMIHAQPSVTLEILPGGKSWPLLLLDEGGHIYIFGTVINGATGRVVAWSDAVLALPYGVEVAVVDERYRFRRGGKECRLSPRQLYLDRKKSALGALKDANLVLICIWRSIAEPIRHTAPTILPRSVAMPTRCIAT